MSDAHPFLPKLSRPLVLASRSPRRRALLRSQGLFFETMPADVDESMLGGESPEDHVLRLSADKALRVASARLKAAVLGSDTVVVIDGEVLGKPATEPEARVMLERLAGRSHVVHTGVALVCAQREFVATRAAQTVVHFRELSVNEIANYVATGEPMDKAGAYGIQERGALLVDRIEGCYFNVMGLPLQELRLLMLELAEAESPGPGLEGEP